MQLRELAPGDFDLIAHWLSRVENYQWLDFAGRGQNPSAMNLRLMAQREIHCFRVFVADAGDAPIGVVVLSDISRLSRTASLWYVLGDKTYGGRGFTSQAVAALLDHGVEKLGIQAFQAWAVAENEPSIRVLNRNGFRLIGRQRRCHYLNGRLVDRLLFDLLATDRRESPCAPIQT